MKHLRLLAFLMLPVAVQTAALSCQGDASHATEQVRGRIVEVQASSLLTLTSMAVVDDSGRRWEFVAQGGYQGFPPSHLREHMLLGQPVTVTYRRRGDLLVLVEVAD